MSDTSKKGTSQPAQLPAIGIALFVVFLWATSWVLIKIGLEDIPAITFAGLRYFMAFICLLPFAIRIQLRPSSAKITRRMWGTLILLGILLYALTQGAVFLSLDYLPAVTTNLLWSFSSVTVAIFGIAWLAEYPTRFQWMGIGLATFGAVVYFYPVTLPSGYLVGILAALVGVISNAGASILGRGINRSREMHPLVVTAVSMGIGAGLLLLAGIVSQGLPAISWKGWLIIAWLAVVNTAVAFTLWNYTLQTLTATESSIINGTMLIWIPILAVIFLDEQVTAKEILGLILAGIGTIFVQLKYPSAWLRTFKGRTGR